MGDISQRLAHTLSLLRSLMDLHGLSDWEGGIGRFRRANGLCYFERKRIRLNKEYVLLASEDDVRDTILHEIAHALVGPESASHGQAWRDKALEIGADPDRVVYAGPWSGKWTAICCNLLYRRHRSDGRAKCVKCERKLSFTRSVTCSGT